jgi:uncharacterized protein (UPF0335 family)
MAYETGIYIHLKLLDEFSANMQKFQSNLQKVAQRGMEVGRTMKQVGREISILGQTMMWTGTAMTAPLILAFKSAEKYSVDVARQTEKLNAVFIGLRTTVAESMLPTVKIFTDLLGKIYLAFKNVSPATRETIVNFILLNGAFLLIGGTLLMVIGRFVRILGILIDLPARFLSWAAFHPILFAIAAGLMVVIGAMELFAGKTVSTLGKAQLAIDMIRIGYDKLTVAILNVLKWNSYLLGQFDLAHWFKGQITAIETEIKKLQTDMQKVFETGKATGFLSNIEDIKKAFADIQKNLPSLNWDALIQYYKDMKLKIETEVKTLADVMNDTMKNVATQMASSLGNFFGNVLAGQIDDAKQMFADFGNAVLNIIGQVMAQLLISETLGRIWPAAFNILGLKFHQGGVVKAHSGLATDEVPVIAQAGEGIISRRGMSALGRDNFSRLNRGEGAGSNQMVIHYYIMAADARSFVDLLYQNKASIHGIVQSAMTTNSPLRGTMKKYG